MRTSVVTGCAGFIGSQLAEQCLDRGGSCHRYVEVGLVVNVARGGEWSMRQLIAMLEEIAGRPNGFDLLDQQRGDVRRTGVATRRARDHLGMSPEVGRREDLERQHDWYLSGR